MKRFFDISASLFGLVVSAPIFLILIPIIRFNSEGAGIFRQERVGRFQKSFTCYKLRTMATGTVQAGTHEVSESSVTSVGTFLRATKLDELPQLWNVLRGDMAFVGPRPCLPVQRELVEERASRGVYEIAPGITGLAQIAGIDMSDPVKLAKKDAEYVQIRSFGLDLKIIFQTLTGSGQGDKVNSAVREDS
ncbi:UNVERIFIED_CONTAM: hypothetical protein GTU68_001703 [Idotea baltica]|nr:hypothetical protein [Idotea baltica]